MEKSLKEHPNSTVTQLRKSASALYAWHYRNNRKCLKDNSPKAKPKIYNNNRVNWKRRDLEVLKQVKKIIQELYSLKKPVYVDRSKIGKELNKTYLIEKLIDKMPEIKKYLEIHIETREEYQIRRINWAANKCIEEELSMEEWKIRRLAGLKKDLHPEVTQTLRSMIEKRSIICLIENKGGF